MQDQNELSIRTNTTNFLLSGRLTNYVICLPSNSDIRHSKELITKVRKNYFPRSLKNSIPKRIKDPSNLFVNLWEGDEQKETSLQVHGPPSKNLHGTRVHLRRSDFAPRQWNTAYIERVALCVWLPLQKYPVNGAGCRVSVSREDRV